MMLVCVFGCVYGGKGASPLSIYFAQSTRQVQEFVHE